MPTVASKIIPGGSFFAVDADKVEETDDAKVMTGAERIKVGLVSVTGAVDLDAVRDRIAALASAVVMRGGWAASSGTFPGGGSAQAGDAWIVTATGTIDGVEFTASDRIIATADNASTTTFAGNWFKADYTDQVQRVAGKTGDVTLNAEDIAETFGFKVMTLAERAKLELVKTLRAVDLDKRLLSYERPGAVPEFFTVVASGGSAGVGVTGTAEVNARGPALRLGGNQWAVLRQRFPVGHGEAWAIRATFSRFADPAELDGHDVLFRLTWLDATDTAVGTVSLWPPTPGQVLTEADGLVTASAIVGEGSLVDFVTPASAVAFTIGMRTLGTDGLTDFETLRVAAVDFTPAVDGLSGAIATEAATRQAATESLDAAIGNEAAARAIAVAGEAAAREATRASLVQADVTAMQPLVDDLDALDSGMSRGLWAVVVDSKGQQVAPILVNGDGTTSLVPAQDVLDALDARRLAVAEGDPATAGTELLRTPVSGEDFDRVLAESGGVTRPYLQRSDIASDTFLFDTASHIVMLPHAGQSWSIGGGADEMPSGEEIVNGTPLTPAHLVMFNDNLGMRGRGTLAATTPANYTNFVPGKEAFNGYVGETQGSGLGSWLHREGTRRKERAAAYLYRAHGAGGQAIAALSKGTQPYANGITDVTKAVEIAAIYGKEVQVPVIFWSQGQEDAAIGTSGADYKTALAQLLADYRADWAAILPVGNPTIGMVMDQVTARVDAFIGEVTQAQWEFARDTAGVYLSTPSYFLPFVDNVHVVPAGYALLGEYQGKVWRRVVIEGEDWKALWPTAVAESGRDIVITFNVPRGELALDTVTMPAAENYGFSVVDTGGAEIEGVYLEGNTVRLRMTAATVADASRRVRYAWDGPGNIAGRAGAWGNLRDTDDALSYQQPGRRLYNWCVAFNEAF
ncbi:sialate O-acetylesterase [Acuticoccus sediminis]|uniref:sialate O-acetylesterase n=1 Tax=Acuticoccus sediminis TaxID=2184697 RepID=UPI001CFECCFF|nr:sialate O-acetylesterase [Acuticoccus sediminis]